MDREIVLEIYSSPQYDVGMKQLVDVICVHYRSGEVKPLFVVWDNGVKYPIDQVSDIRPAVSLKNGGAGIRYTCRFQSNWRYLFFNNNQWFIEKM